MYVKVSKGAQHFHHYTFINNVTLKTGIITMNVATVLFMNTLLVLHY